jgi:hypothetical protein
MDFNLLHMLTKKKWMIIFLSVCVGFITLTSILHIALFGELSFEIGICFTLAMALVLLYLARIFIFPRFAYKKMRGYMSNHTVEFYEKTLVAITEGEGLTGQTECSYSSIVMVRESRANLFLYISEHEAIILSKSDIEGGDCEALVAHMRERCDPKAFKGYKRVEK